MCTGGCPSRVTINLWITNGNRSGQDGVMERAIPGQHPNKLGGLPLRCRSCIPLKIDKIMHETAFNFQVLMCNNNSH